jgi:Camelysin metallo-endopeptidase
MNEHETHRDGTADAPASRRARHRGPRREGGRRLALAVVPLAIVVSGAFVYQASNAAFVATTSSTASFATGTVTLSNNAPAGVLFNVTGMKPGDSNNACVNVTYSGSLGSDVRLYLTSLTGSTGAGGLADFLRFTVEEGAGTCASNPAYSYLAGSAVAGVSLTSLAGATNFANGLSSWDTTAVNGGLHSFRVTWSLPDYGGTGPAFGAAGAPANQAAFDALQGTNVGATFTWEAHNK